MIEIACRLHAPDRAVAHETTIQVHPDGTVERGAPFAAVTGLERIAVSPRIGHAARRLVFDDGITGESDDSDAIDRALAGCRGGRYRSLLAVWHGRWRWTLIALIAAGAALYLLISRGLRWAE